METQERLRRIDPARLTAFQAELLRKEYSVGTAENYLRAVRAFARWSGGEVERGLVLTWKAQLTARYAPATVHAMLAGSSAAASGRRNGNWTGKNTARWSAPPERWGGSGWRW